MRPTSGVPARPPEDQLANESGALDAAVLTREIFKLCIEEEPDSRADKLAASLLNYEPFCKKTELKILSTSELSRLRTAHELALSALRAHQSALEQQVRAVAAGLTNVNAHLSAKIDREANSRYGRGAFELPDSGEFERDENGRLKVNIHGQPIRKVPEY